jgi:hypothetical protein
MLLMTCAQRKAVTFRVQISPTTLSRLERKKKKTRWILSFEIFCLADFVFGFGFFWAPTLYERTPADQDIGDVVLIHFVRVLCLLAY